MLSIPFFPPLAPLHLSPSSRVSVARELAGKSRKEKLALLRAHPELAGRAAIEGKLTTESTDEQSKARLDRCTPEEYEQFHRLNEAYNKKFDFPFIMAIRNSNRVEILESFKHRLQNEINEEFRTALDNVHLIASLRLQAILSDDLG